MEDLSRGVSDMETDSITGDGNSAHGSAFSVDPVIDSFLIDSFCQQQGWIRVYGMCVCVCHQTGFCTEFNT